MKPKRTLMDISPAEIRRLRRKRSQMSDDAFDFRKSVQLITDGLTQAKSTRTLLAELSHGEVKVLATAAREKVEAARRDDFEKLVQLLMDRRFGRVTMDEIARAYQEVGARFAKEAESKP